MIIGVAINAIFFLGIGLSALIQPQFVVSFVKLIPETADARNGIGAAYGGFGITVVAGLHGIRS
jgi:hypothetical protein